MNTNKNSYTIIYTVVLVAIVAAVLAFVSMSLKDRQLTNIAVEKQQNILNCAGLASNAKQAPDKNAYIQKEFAANITEALIVNVKGEIIAKDTVDLVKSAAFKVAPADQFDLLRTGSKEDVQLPVFVCKTSQGTVRILSCYGAGLWGPIWGYIAIKEDLTTIAGALFDHKSETPGLGGEIATDKFRGQFVGKIIFENEALTPVKVVKGGAKNPEHEIDALSGATITSTAVQSMIAQWLECYEPYLKKCKNN